MSLYAISLTLKYAVKNIFSVQLHYYGSNEVSTLKSSKGLHPYTEENKAKFKLRQKSAKVQKAIAEADAALNC